MSNVGSNEKNSSDINTTDADFLFADTDLQALFDNDFELQKLVTYPGLNFQERTVVCLFISL
jgi:hypothetical protein